MGARRGVDELRVDADPVLLALHRALDHIADAKLPADLLGVDALAPVSERRPGRDHEAFLDARQVGGQVFGDPVGEVILRFGSPRDWRKAAPPSRDARVCGRRSMKVLKKPDGYRRDYAQGSNARDKRSEQVLLRERERRRFRGLRSTFSDVQRVDPNRLGDVLKASRAEITGGEVKPPPSPDDRRPRKGKRRPVWQRPPVERRY